MKIRLLLLMLATIVLSACSDSAQGPRELTESDRWMASSGKTRVLCTTAMIQDIVEQIGGDSIVAITLIHRQLDPHSYELVKGDDEKLSYADLIFANGLGLEHGPSLQTYLDDSPKAVHLGDLIRDEDADLILYVNGQPDPHIWTDVSMWARIVPHVVTALSRFSPEHALEYAQRGRKVSEEMLAVDQQIAENLQAIPDSQRYLVTSHDAFNYFTRRYLAAPTEKTAEDWNARFEAPEGLAPEAQLSPVDIERLISHMAKHGISVLFSESNVSKDSISKIVHAGRERGLDLRIATTPLFGDAMGAPGSDGDTYLKMALHNADVIGKHLREQSLPVAIDLGPEQME